MKRTYLFDFDGTLVDSMPSFISVMLRILDENGIPYGEDIVRIITPLGYRGTAEYFRTLGLEEETEALITRMNDYARDAYFYTIPAKAGVEETLRAMRARGDSLSVLTASPHTVLDPCLKRVGLWDYFDNVWSCDDFATTKADPEIYRMAAKRLSCDVEKMIFVDDNLGAVRTAKRAGAFSCGIFDASSASDAPLFRAEADGYVEHFTELFDLNP